MVIRIMEDITLMQHNLLLLAMLSENNNWRNCGRPAFSITTLPTPIVFFTPWLIPVFT